VERGRRAATTNTNSANIRSPLGHPFEAKGLLLVVVGITLAATALRLPVIEK